MRNGENTALLPFRREGLENRTLGEAVAAPRPSPHAPETPRVLVPGGELGSRLAAMDALRGGAMLLGIFIHAAISYMPSNLTDLFWGIREQNTSQVLDVLFWWIHACRLPLFFVIAGFFAELVYRTKGQNGFLDHRVRRLLIPFFVGVALMLPMGYIYAWACGVLQDRVTDADIFVFEILPMVVRELPGPMHLWFLEDLMILSLIFVGYRWIRKGDLNDEPQVRCPSWLLLLAPFAVAVPSTVLLWLEPRPLVAHHNSFVPEPMRLLHYGYFFIVGTVVYRYRNSLREIYCFPIIHLGLSAVACVIMLDQLPIYFDDNSMGRWALAGSAATLAWLSVFGFMGLTLRCFQGKHPIANYLADSAYWIYLFHLPTVCLVQLALVGVDLDPILKCGIVVVVTAALGLMSYQTLIRYTFLGACLHGIRRRK